MSGSHGNHGGFIQAARNKWLPLLLAAAVVGGSTMADAKPPSGSIRVIQFSGDTWYVRSAGVGGPGPNQWDPGGVRVDRQGRLHLKITKQDGVWRCAEVWTLRQFGFGRYQFQVTGALDRLDPNVVLGLFNYPPASVGPDGTNEIDIEYSRWGNPAWFPASDTVYPAQAGLASVSHGFAMPPNLLHTTQRFDWQNGGVRFQNLGGQLDSGQKQYAHWVYRPAGSRRRIPQRPLPIHINLWLVGGHAPKNGKEVEVIVNSFTFLPLSASHPSTP